MLYKNTQDDYTLYTVGPSTNNTITNNNNNNVDNNVNIMDYIIIIMLL